ncbi:hypothetical protein KWG64_06350 [Rahnella sp. PD12R]|uniref:hypothetical protein n=1 Tax=Rahnella sp. PD12R TaxID=2855688 RepID=UPI001C48F5C1|nr:hypothetical protein [Rahnella sp. PD12R]MBV6817561.1 hypothetical protein [Rahnella sp. PD12R]
MQLSEMQGLLAGKCLPGDMKVNESLAEYLLRKLEDRNELERQLSAKTISEQNIINAFGIKGEGAHSKLVIEYVSGLVALAEERREFIVNGVEYDYIELPLFEEDRANATYQRCLLKDGYAAADITAELRAQGVDEYANATIAIGEDERNLDIIYAGNQAKLFAANLRAGRKG